MASDTRHVLFDMSETPRSRFDGNYFHVRNQPPWRLSDSPTRVESKYWDLLEQELAENDRREFPLVGPFDRQRFEQDNHDDSRSKTNIKSESQSEQPAQKEAPTVTFTLQPPEIPSIPAMGPWSFMDWFPEGNATIIYQNDDGDIESVNNLDYSIIKERCPLLAAAFEESRSGPQLYLEALTPATALPFIRFLYMSTYAVDQSPGTLYEDVPTSVLRHCQLYRLGDIYDLPDLKTQAYVNVVRQCEFGCSSADQPVDLCPAIRFVYKYLSQHQSLIETIVGYCVSCFLQHRLADDEDFKQLAFKLRPFHQDLCKNSMGREFENETAAAIIQMPFAPYVPETYASREDKESPRIKDVVFHFHSHDDFDTPKEVKKSMEPVSTRVVESAITLALRTKREYEAVVQHESEEDSHQPEVGRKRRALSFEHSARGSQESNSDGEYELVPRPAPVQVLDSDSESDGGKPVLVEHVLYSPSSASSSHPRRDLPIREKARDENLEPDSDSEWSLV